jgi:transposase-like protein
MSYLSWAGRPTQRETDAPAVPSTCPVCRSDSISTTAKTPDANSYWRCEACGEVWNAGRRTEATLGGRGWR